MAFWVGLVRFLKRTERKTSRFYGRWYPEFDLVVADGANGCTNKIEKESVGRRGRRRESIGTRDDLFSFVSRLFSFFF